MPRAARSLVLDDATHERTRHHHQHQHNNKLELSVVAKESAPVEFYALAPKDLIAINENA